MIELRPHQVDALGRMSNGKILWGGVGSGKSMVAVAYYDRYEAPKDVIVITTPMKRDTLDWEGEFANLGIGKSKDATLGGILTVDSWNNIKKYEGVKNAFFIFDEQRLVGAGAWSKSFLKIARSNNWILLSGTPGDTWIDYIPVFIANGFYKNRTEFKRLHVEYDPYVTFPKIRRYHGVGVLTRHRNSILVEMPYDRHTTRHPIDVKVGYDKELFNRVVKERWHVYEERPLKNVAELFSVMRRVVNSHEERLSSLEDLLQTHTKVIVFYNFDYELEILRTLYSMDYQKENEECINTKTSAASSNSSTDSDSKPSPPYSNGSSSLGSSTSGTGSTLGSVSTTSLGRTESSPQTESPASTASSGSRGSSTKESTSKTSSETSGFTVAERNGHRHDGIPDSERWVYLVQYTSGAEGWNCIETNATVFYSLNYSYKILEQSMGRTDRLNTPFLDLYYYLIRSDSPIDRAIWRALKDKKSFNESDYDPKY